MNDLLDRVGLTTADIRDKVSSAAVAASQYIGSWAVSAGQSAVRFGLMFFVMLYVLYFFLRDGAELLEVIIHVLPIGDERERELFAKFAEVSRATIKGTIVIGIVQGALGGLIFGLLGVEAAVFLGGCDGCALNSADAGGRSDLGARGCDNGRKWQLHKGRHTGCVRSAGNRVGRQSIASDAGRQGYPHAGLPDSVVNAGRTDHVWCFRLYNRSHYRRPVLDAVEHVCQGI